MGWTFTAMPRQGIKAYMDGIYTWTNENGSGGRVIDSALVARTEYYCAVKDNLSDRVWCGVAMLQVVPNARDGYPFGYKDMDESVGPYQYRCPERILSLLTPTDSAWANEWREKCRTYIATRRGQPKVGQTFRLAQPMRFTDGTEQDTFTVVPGGRTGKAKRYRAPNGGLYRISGVIGGWSPIT